MDSIFSDSSVKETQILLNRQLLFQPSIEAEGITLNSNLVKAFFLEGDENELSYYLVYFLITYLNCSGTKESRLGSKLLCVGAPDV